MTTDVRRVVPARSSVSLPREHGFWTMLAAVVAVSVARSEPSPGLVLVAVTVVTGAVLLGALFGRSIRRHASLQLAAAVAMSVVAVPIEIVGKIAPASIALTVLAWAVVFASSALSVRASFARASRKHRAQARWLQRGAEILPCLAAILFAALEARGPTAASLVAAAGCIALGAKKPSVKQMKAVGLFLAGVTLFAGIALGSL